MIEKYELEIEIGTWPEDHKFAFDSSDSPRPTIVVYCDWENIFNWGIEGLLALPPNSVVEFHDQFCGEILSALRLDDQLRYLTGDQDEDGRKGFSWVWRKPNYAKVESEAERVYLLVSLDADEDGEPTDDALTELHDAIKTALARYNERVEAWYWSDPDYP